MGARALLRAAAAQDVGLQQREDRQTAAGAVGYRHQSRGIDIGIRAREHQLPVEDGRGARIAVGGIGDLQGPRAQLGQAHGAGSGILKQGGEDDRRGGVGGIDAEGGARQQSAVAPAQVGKQRPGLGDRETRAADADGQRGLGAGGDVGRGPVILVPGVEGRSRGELQDAAADRSRAAVGVGAAEDLRSAADLGEGNRAELLRIVAENVPFAPPLPMVNVAAVPFRSSISPDVPNRAPTVGLNPCRSSVPPLTVRAAVPDPKVAAAPPNCKIPALTVVPPV